MDKYCLAEKNLTEKILDSKNLQKLIDLLGNEEIKSRTEIRIKSLKLSDRCPTTAISYDGSSDLTKQDKAPVIPINDLAGPYARQCSEEENEMRCQLATLYRLMFLHGWILNIYNHITLRLSGDSKEFFINPFGLLFREITASSLVKITLDGQTLDRGSTIFGINKAGWNLHAALHDSRDDIRCLIHAHVPDVIAVSSVKYGLLPLSEEAVELLDESDDSLSRGVRYHEYWGVAVNPDEWISIQEDLGPSAKVLFLRNHGVIVCGNDCVEAWALIHRVVRACEHQIRLLNAKGEKGLLSMEHMTHQRAATNNCGVVNNSLKVELEFEALMRELDNAGYCTGYKYRHGSPTEKEGSMKGQIHQAKENLL